MVGQGGEGYGCAWDPVREEVTELGYGCEIFWVDGFWSVFDCTGDKVEIMDIYVSRRYGWVD